MSKRTLFTAVAVVAAAAGLYGLAGFYWLPRVIQSRTVEFFEQGYGRAAELGEVRFNPFTFEFEARAFSLPDEDGERMLGFDRFYVDFELASLWHRAWTFRAIDLEQPYVRVVQRADGAINLADLASTDQEPAAPAEEPAEIPSLRIDDLTVLAGQVDIVDRARAEPFSTSLAPVTFELTEFRTAGSGNQFSFEAGSDRAGRLTLDGTFGVEPLSSKGSLALAGLQATTISDYLGELLPVTIKAGVVDLGFNYDFSLSGDPFKFTLDMPSLAVRDLATVAKGHEIPWNFSAIDLRDTRVDLAARSLTVNSVEVKGVLAPVWLDDSGLNLPGALGLTAAALAAPAPITGESDGQEPGWTVSIPAITLLDAELPFENRNLKPPAALAVTARTVRVEGYALPARGPLQLSAVVASGAGGEVSVAGPVKLEPLAAQLDLTVDALDLRPVQPYLDESTDLLFRSGTLSTRGRLEYADGAPATLRYEGDLTVNNLRTQDRPLKEDFVNWASLEVKGIRYASEPAAIRIEEIVARQPYLRLILAETGVSNIESVLDPEAATRKAAEIAAEREAARSGKDAKRKQSREPADEAPAPPPAAEPAAPAMDISIGNTRIVDGNVNFADYTLRPNFKIAMEQLNGYIKGSSSKPDARSQLQLDGQVDRYAPVHIDGALNLLSATTFIDINASFHNIELTSFNPYSTKFAGYQIDKGKLSIDTQYKVEDRRLEARHKVTVDQLELGDKVDSPDAIGLPLKLAVALLKDSRGVIELDLPISGTVDDPQFKLGPIIWKAFVGLLTKIVTAPFTLLGSLFGGGEDLSYLEFAAGSATLDPPAQQKLAALKKALVERPTLKLDVPAAFDPGLDRPALERARWEAAVRAAGSAAGAPPASDDAWKTDRAQYLRRLETMHREKTGQKADLPKPPKPAEGEPKPDPVEFAIGLLEPELRAGVTVADEDLAALGQARANAVRDALLGDGTIPGERVFVIRGEETETAGSAVRVALALQ